MNHLLHTTMQYSIALYGTNEYYCQILGAWMHVPVLKPHYIDLPLIIMLCSRLHKTLP